jgi:hypothetical protein
MTLAPPVAALRRTALQQGADGSSDAERASRAPTRGEAMADTEMSL